MQTSPIAPPPPASARTPVPQATQSDAAASFADVLSSAQSEPPPKTQAHKPPAPGRKEGAKEGAPKDAPPPEGEACAADGADEADGAKKAAKSGKDTPREDTAIDDLLPGWPGQAATPRDAAARGGKAAAEALQGAAKPGRERAAAGKDLALDAAARAAQGRADDAATHAAAAGRDAGVHAAFAEAAQQALLPQGRPTTADTAGHAATLPAAMASAEAAATARHDGAAASATPFQAHLAAAVQSPEFAPALGAQVRVFAEGGVQEAQLHLNPPEMGPITVQIELVGAQARVEFTAEQAATRAAIENGLPELAAALRESGLTLSGGGVFEQSRQRDGGDAGGQGRRDGREREDGGVELARETPAARARPRGVVDLYA